MNIRKATVKDFDKLYSLGLNTPELQVTDNEPFMYKDEFKSCIKNKTGIFYLAEENNEIIGFIYFDTRDAEKNYENCETKWACLVYIAVNNKHRGKNIATKLYETSIKDLKKNKVTNVYAWANPKSGVLDFLKKKDFKEGHECIWMDRKI